LAQLGKIVGVTFEFDQEVVEIASNSQKVT